MRKALALASALIVMGAGSPATSKAATVLIGGVPVKQLYVDDQGRLYLTAGPGRRPVNVEIPHSAVGGTPVASKDQKLKVSGEARVRWDYDTEGKKEHNAFKVARNYLEVRGYFNGKDYYRTTLDVTQPTSGGAKGSYLVRLKYGYVYLADVLPYTGLELGLGHRAWIDWEEHHGWVHPDVIGTLIDKLGLTTSAGVGADFKGHYSIASWQFGIFNGEGYHGVENSEHFGKSLEGRLSLNLFPGFTLSGHTAHSFDNKGSYTDTTPEDHYDRHIYQVHAVYNNPYFLAAAQYIWDNDDYYGNKDSQKPHGYSVNGDLKLKPVINYPVDLFGRYDHWDTDKGGKDQMDRYVGGVAYNYSKHIKLSLADIREVKDTKVGSDSNKVTAVAQIKW